MDVATAVVARARETCALRLGSLDGVHVQRQNLNESLSLPDAFVDAVTAIAVIEHIFDPYFAIAEIHRVLSDDGQLIMEVPNLAWLPRRLDVLIGRLPVTGEEEGWDGGHLHYFTFDAVYTLLESSGFHVVYMGSTGIFPRVRNLWPTLLGGNILVKARKRSHVAKD
jgi:SAM-dependent methyltransferase